MVKMQFVHSWHLLRSRLVCPHPPSIAETSPRERMRFVNLIEGSTEIVNFAGEKSPWKTIVSSTFGLVLFSSLTEYQNHIRTDSTEMLRFLEMFSYRGRIRSEPRNDKRNVAVRVRTWKQLHRSVEEKTRFGVLVRMWYNSIWYSIYKQTHFNGTDCEERTFLVPLSDECDRECLWQADCFSKVKFLIGNFFSSSLIFVILLLIIHDEVVAFGSRIHPVCS